MSDPRPDAPIVFNRPWATGREAVYIAEALGQGHLSGDGPFSRRCHAWLEHELGCSRALLVHSCTAALEMAALLLDLMPGDEVIMPSFTFVSTANAFVLRGATPVFVDIDPRTLCLDTAQVAEAITPRTRAVVPVHYAGACGDMDALTELAARHDLAVVEDAAQALGSRWHGRALGTLGHLGTLSFHETKNIHAGEGGALLVGDARYAARAEILREKGTNRSAFFRGEIDKYTWVDVGSSYLPGELTAAALLAQLEASAEITARRRALWATYHEAFADLEADGLLRRPMLLDGVEHNAHLYHLLLPDGAARDDLLAALKAERIHALFHYVPLHSAPAGRRLGRAHGALPVTDQVSATLLRLPLWLGLEAVQARVIERVRHHVCRRASAGSQRWYVATTLSTA